MGMNCLWKADTGEPTFQRTVFMDWLVSVYSFSGVMRLTESFAEINPQNHSLCMMGIA